MYDIRYVYDIILDIDFIVNDIYIYMYTYRKKSIINDIQYIVNHTIIE